MSDTAAAAPVVAPTTTDATASTPGASADTTPKPPAPPADPKVELEALLKKTGGLEVKAGGKVHKLDSLEKLVRYAQRGIPVEQSLEEVAAARAEVEPVKALFAKLKSGNEDEAEAALEQLMDRGVIDKVAERRLRRQFEKEKSLEGLTPREREYAAQLEAERARAQKLEESQKAIEKQRAEALEQQQVRAAQEHVGGVIVSTLKALDLPDKLEPLALQFMKPMIAASLRAGMPLDPSLLAEKVRPVLDQLFEYQVKNLEGEALLKRFPAEVSSRFRKALLAQLNGSKPAAPVETKPSEPAKAPVWDPRKMW